MDNETNPVIEATPTAATPAPVTTATEKKYVLSSYISSLAFRRILYIVGALILALLIFQCGIFVGARKAGFARSWGENYNRNFGGPPAGFMQDFRGQDFIGGHGAAGSIIRLDGNRLIIKGADNVERIIAVDNSTAIQRGNQSIRISDLRPNDQIVVLGVPTNDGTIAAKMIRLFSADDRLPMPRLEPRPFIHPLNR